MDHNEAVVKAIDSIGTAFDEFKAFNDERINGLAKTVDRLEIKLARPGNGYVTESLGGSINNGPVRTLKTRQGLELPYLMPEQKLSAFRGVSPFGSRDEQFDLGVFCRDAVCGSREQKASSGAAFVPNGLSSMVVDRVRAMTVVSQAGAGTIVIDGPTNLARITGDPTVYQHTEGATDISESDVTATAIALNPKTLAVLIPLTVELVSDSPNLDAILQTALAEAFAAKLDALCIATMLADTNVPKSAVAHDPALWAGVLAAVGAALALNQDLPDAHIGTPANYIARAGQLASTAGSWLGKPPGLANMRELFTSTMTADQSLFGDFRRGFAIAMRDELRLEIIRHAKPTSGSHLLVAHMRADGIVLQPNRLFWQKKVVS